MTMHWWQEGSIRKWAWQAWRFYSWRPRYRLTLTTAESSAYVDMVNHVVVCNPEYPYPPLQQARQVRHLPLDVRDFQLLYLESLIAHEAGHTHHSGQKPPGLLGQLVNIIEDERMERLMARDFPSLKRLFEFAADTDAAHSISQNGFGGDLIRGCLFHRFTCTHPNWAFKPDGSDAPQWPAVRIILEEAWEAETFEEVVEASRRILKLLGRREEDAPDERLEAFLDGEGQQLEGPRAPGAGGQGAGGGGGDEREDGPPARPDLDARPSADCTLLKDETEGEARRLAGILKQPGNPGRTMQSRDRGRYRYDRDVTGSDRPFDLKVGAQEPGATHLRLAVDMSGSMSAQGRMVQARRLMFIATYAAQKAGVPLLAVAFDDDVQVLATPGTKPDTALNAVAALTERGGTTLAPALKVLWKPNLPGKSVTFIITDGQLEHSDYLACARLRAEHRGVVVPVLLERDESVRRAYEAAFGVCVMLQDPAELTSHVVSFLRNRK